jgi:hypothetical protein
MIGMVIINHLAIFIRYSRGMFPCKLFTSGKDSTALNHYNPFFELFDMFYDDVGTSRRNGGPGCSGLPATGELKVDNLKPQTLVRPPAAQTSILPTSNSPGV